MSNVNNRHSTALPQRGLRTRTVPASQVPNSNATQSSATASGGPGPSQRRDPSSPPSQDAEFQAQLATARTALLESQNQHLQEQLESQRLINRLQRENSELRASRAPSRAPPQRSRILTQELENPDEPIASREHVEGNIVSPMARDLLQEEEDRNSTPGSQFGLQFSDEIRELPERKILERELARERNLPTSTPKPYKGESVDKYEAFVQEWKRVFRTKPWSYNRHSDRINAAAQGLAGELINLWDDQVERSPGDIKTWDDFTQWLLKQTANPVSMAQRSFEQLRNFN